MSSLCLGLISAWEGDVGQTDRQTLCVAGLLPELYHPDMNTTASRLWPGVTRITSRSSRHDVVRPWLTRITSRGDSASRSLADFRRSQPRWECEHLSLGFLGAGKRSLTCCGRTSLDSRPEALFQVCFVTVWGRLADKCLSVGRWIWVVAAVLCGLFDVLLPSLKATSLLERLKCSWMPSAALVETTTIIRSVDQTAVSQVTSSTWSCLVDRSSGSHVKAT